MAVTVSTGGGEPEANGRVFLDLVRLAQTGSTGEQVAATSTLDSIECGISANNPRILQLAKKFQIENVLWLLVESTAFQCGKFLDLDQSFTLFNP